MVVDQLNIAEGKTKVLGNVLANLGAHGKSVLTVGGAINDLGRRHGSKLKNLKILQSRDLNVYDLLWCETLVVTQEALGEIQELWG
ncbi:MAG: 50S ribosomal protein L4 [Nitrospirales bacterium]